MKVTYAGTPEIVTHKNQIDKIWAELQDRQTTQEDIEKLGGFCEKWQSKNAWPSHLKVQWVTNMSKIITTFIARSKIPLSFTLPDSIWKFYWQLVGFCRPAANFHDLVTALFCMLNAVDRTNMEAWRALILSSTNGYIYELKEDININQPMNSKPSKWDIGVSSSKQPQARWVEEDDQPTNSSTNKLVAGWMSELMKQIYYLRALDHSQTSFEKLYNLLATDPTTLGLPASSALPLDPYVLSGLLTDLRLSLQPMVRSPLHFKTRPALPPILSQLEYLTQLQSALIMRLYQIEQPADLSSKNPKVIKLVSQTVVERTVFAVLYCWETDTASQTGLKDALRWIIDPDSKLMLIRMLWAAVFPPAVDKPEVLEQVFRLALKVFWVADTLQDFESVDKTMLGILSNLVKFKKSHMNPELPVELASLAIQAFDIGYSAITKLIRAEFSSTSETALLQKKSSTMFSAQPQSEYFHPRMSQYRSALSHTYSLLMELSDTDPGQVLNKLETLNPNLDNQVLQLFEQEWIIYLISKSLNNPLYGREPANLVNSLLGFGQSTYRGPLKVRYLLCLYECWSPAAGSMMHEQEEELIELEALILEENSNCLKLHNKLMIWKAVTAAFEEASQIGWSDRFEDMLVKLRYHLCRLGLSISDSCRKISATTRVEDLMDSIDNELQSHFINIDLPSNFSAEYILQQFVPSTTSGQQRSPLKGYLEIFSADHSLVKMLTEIQSYAKVYHRHKLALSCSKLLVLVMLYMSHKELTAQETANAEIKQKTSGTFSPFDLSNQSATEKQNSPKKLPHDSSAPGGPIFSEESKGLPVLLNFIGDLCVNMADAQDLELESWINILSQVFSPYKSKLSGSSAAHDPFTKHLRSHAEYTRHKISLDLLESAWGFHTSGGGSSQTRFKRTDSLYSSAHFEGHLLGEINKNPQDFRMLMLYSRLLSHKAPNSPDPFVRAFLVKEVVSAAACFRSTVFHGIEGVFDPSKGVNPTWTSTSPDACVYKVLHNFMSGMKLLKIHMYSQLRKALRVGFHVAHELGMFRICNKLSSEYIKYAEFLPNIEDLALGLLMKSEIKVVWTSGSLLRDFLERQLRFPIESWCFQESKPEDVIKKHQMQIKQQCQELGISSQDNVLLLVWLTARDLMGAEKKAVLARMVGQSLLLEDPNPNRLKTFSGESSQNKMGFRVLAGYETDHSANPVLLKQLSDELFIFVETLLETTKSNVRMLNYHNPDRICQLLEQSFLDTRSHLHTQLFSQKCGLLKLIAAAMQTHFVSSNPCPSGLPGFLSPVAVCMFWICIQQGMFSVARSIFEFILALGQAVPADKLALMALQITNSSYRLKKSNKALAIELLKAAKSGKRKSMRRMTMRKAESLEEFYKYSWLLTNSDTSSNLQAEFPNPVIQDPKIPLVVMGSYKNMWNSMRAEENIHIVFRSDGRNWIYSILSKDYAGHYLRLIELLVENEAMLKRGSDEKMSASKWWTIREQAEKTLENQINNLEDSLGLDVLLFNSECNLSGLDSNHHNQDIKPAKDVLLKTILQNLTTYSDSALRVMHPRLNQLKAKYVSSSRYETLEPSISKTLKTPRKLPTPMKSKASGPIVMVNTWNQENPSSSLHEPQSRNPSVPTKPMFLMLDGLQHMIPFEHMSILAEFQSTQIYRVTDVSGVKMSRPPSSNQNTRDSGFLTQISVERSSSEFRPNNSGLRIVRPLKHKQGEPVAYYLINPKGDLKNTEKRMKQFVGKFKSWVGKVGEEPHPREIVEYLQNHIDFM